MPPDARGRRFLAALADTTPAFTRRPVHVGGSRGQRFLAALTDVIASTPLRRRTDEYTSEHRGTAVDVPAAVAAALTALPPVDRLAARRTVLPYVAVLWALGQIPHHTRVVDRAVPVEVVRARIEVIASALDLDLDLALSLDTAADLALGLEQDLGQVRDIRQFRGRAREQVDIRGRVRDRARDLAALLDTDLALVHDRSLARDLVRGLIRIRGVLSDLDLAVRASNPDLTGARGLDDDIAGLRDYAFDAVFARVLDVLARTAGLDLPGEALPSYQLELLAAAADAIETAVSDFAGADLSAAELDGVPLNGVLWSSGTRWPADWQTYVEVNSVAVGPDLFQISGGADLDSLADPTAIRR